jgi:hypothetical protein
LLHDKRVKEIPLLKDLKPNDLKRQMAELRALNQATQVALQKLLAKDELMAQR